MIAVEDLNIDLRIEYRDIVFEYTAASIPIGSWNVHVEKLRQPPPKFSTLEGRYLVA